MESEIENKKQNENYIIVRSFLGANSEILLESLNQFRHTNKVESDDLFGDSHETKSINYNLNFPKKSKKDILIEEKNSLGLYVSGNPLANYQDLVTQIQDSVYRDDVNLILINKIKKIFTKKNAMMFALLVSTPFGDYEAIIFPKKAMALSPILQEKEIFWVIGKIEEGQKSENSKVNEDGEAVEYEQKPKILINTMIPLDGDLVDFLSQDKKNPLSQSSKRRVESINIQQFIGKQSLKPAEKTEVKSEAVNSETKILKISKEFGIEKTRQIKSLLKKEQFENSTKVGIEIEIKPGEWKKAKGVFWIDLEKLKELNINL